MPEFQRFEETPKSQHFTWAEGLSCILKVHTGFTHKHLPKDSPKPSDGNTDGLIQQTAKVYASFFMYKHSSTKPPNWNLLKGLYDLVVRSFHSVKGWGLNKMHSNARYQQPCSADESCAHLQLVLTFFGHLCEQFCLLSR